MAGWVGRKHAADDASQAPETQEPGSSGGTHVSQRAVQTGGEAQGSDPQRDQAQAEHPAKPAVHVVADGHLDGTQLRLDGMHQDEGSGE